MLQKSKQRLSGVCLIFLFCFYSFLVHATQGADQRLIYLEQEKNHLINAIHDETQSPESQDAQTEDDKKKLLFRIQLLNSKIDTFDQFLVDEQKNQLSIQREIKKIQRLPITHDDQQNAQEHLRAAQANYKINEQVQRLLMDNLRLARDYERRLTTRLDLFLVKEATSLQTQKINEAKQRIRLLEEIRTKLYQKNIDRTQDNKRNTPEDEILYFLTNQEILLVGDDIAHEQLRIKRIKADYFFSENPDIKGIESATAAYQQVIKEESVLEQSLKKMLVLVQAQARMISDATSKALFLALEKKINHRIESVQRDQRYLISGLEKKQQALKKQLSSRQSLADYHGQGWRDIFDDMVQIPFQLSLYLKSLLTKIVDYSTWHGGMSYRVWGVLGLIVGVAIGLRLFLRRLIKNKTRSRLLAHLMDGVLSLVYQNIPQVALIIMVFSVLMLSQVSYHSCQLLIHLTWIWMIYRQLMLISRLTLLERLDDFSGHDVSLYYRLKWLLMMGAWSTALLVMSYELPLSYILQEIFNGLFMFFLFILSLVLWKSRDAITYVLPPVWRNKKGYVRHVVSLIGVLLPITLLTTALIGFVGYINLAWTMSRYQAYGLLFIAGYVVVRGLLKDMLDLVSEWMVSALYNGWLWVEVLLKPLDKLLRMVLFILSLYLVLVFLGYSSDPELKSLLLTIAHYPLINLSGVHVTLLSLGEFFALLCVFVWVAKWTRECCYRWLYRDVRDLGIRNSLSVFTQYAVILLGFFITIRVLGVDFTGMAVVLGGLAVGMGFGLRDFASNIVGGLMLLIERPVREGDLITIGDYEGKVAHIGIRSMRVSSWDNMEVLIPNAETFNKPFSNWTHQDSIVRTVVPIKVSRVDDPVMIQSLIFDVLGIIPEVLAEPAAQVFLKQIDDTLLEFEVRYFINVRLYTRFEIRSKVLFAIMAQFKAAGVKAPVPALQVELGGHAP